MEFEFIPRNIHGKGRKTIEEVEFEESIEGSVFNSMTKFLFQPLTNDNLELIKETLKFELTNQLNSINNESLYYPKTISTNVGNIEIISVDTIYFQPFHSMNEIEIKLNYNTNIE